MNKFNLSIITTLLLAASEFSVADEKILGLDKLDCVVQPSEVIDVGAAVSGLITEISVDRSDTVNKTDVIIKLESSVEEADERLATSQANTDTAIKLREATLNLGYKTKKRNKQLMKDALISAQEIDKLDTEILIAELNLELERENKLIAKIAQSRATAVLARRNIESPISGVVVQRYKSVGERVDDDPVLRIAQLDPLHIEVVVPVKYRDDIHEDMQASVLPSVEGSANYTAKVERIDKVMDPASGTFGVRLSLPNPDYSIPAGVLCSLDFNK